MCLILWTVQSGIQETGRVRNEVVFLGASIFYSSGLNFDSSEMIYIYIHQ